MSTEKLKKVIVQLKTSIKGLQVKFEEIFHRREQKTKSLKSGGKIGGSVSAGRLTEHTEKRVLLKKYYRDISQETKVCIFRLNQ